MHSITCQICSINKEKIVIVLLRVGGFLVSMTYNTERDNIMLYCDIPTDVQSLQKGHGSFMRVLEPIICMIEKLVCGLKELISQSMGCL